MRRSTVTWTGAAALFVATGFAAPPTQAAGLVRAAQVVNVVQDVRYVCGWWGRRCWTIGYGYYYRPYYVYSPYVYYRP